MNPWKDTSLREVKLIDIDFNEKTAEVQSANNTIFKAPLLLNECKLDILYEVGNYYGATAFLNSHNQLVDYSYLSTTNGTLTEVKQ